MTSLFSRCIWTRSDTQITRYVQSQHRSNILKRGFYEASSVIDFKKIKKQSSLRPAVKSFPALRESAQSEESLRANSTKTVSFRWNHRGSISLKSWLKFLKTQTWSQSPSSSIDMEYYPTRVLLYLCQVCERKKLKGSFSLSPWRRNFLFSFFYFSESGMTQN